MPQAAQAGAGMLARHGARVRPPHETLRVRRRARRPGVRGRPRPGVRLPRRQWRGQDDDDADRPGRARGRCGPGHLAGTESHRLPRSTFGYLPEERGLYPRMRVMDELVFFAGLHGVPAARTSRRARLAAPVPRRGPRGSSGRAALQGQPAEDAVHRGDPPRSGRAAHGRALHGPRPGQRDAPAGGVPGAPGSGSHGRVLDPPDGGGRGAVRVVAIVDRGRMVVGGPLRDVRRAAGAGWCGSPWRTITGCRGWPPCRDAG